MQNHSFTYCIVSSLLITVLCGTGSCKKDSDNQTASQYRLTASNYYENDTLKTADAFQYLGDRINLVRSCYYTTEEDSIKTEIEYKDENNIEQVSYFKFASQWYAIEKILMQKQNGRLVRVEDRYFDGSYWDDMFKMEYSYTSGNLTEEVLYYHEFSSWTPEEKISYEYEGGKPARAFYYDYDNDWVMNYKEDASYTGDKIESITGYIYVDSSFSTDARYEYQYTGNLLMNIKVHLYNAGWEYAGDMAFTYDSHGKLETESAIGSTFSKKYEYTYEEGVGNFAQFVLPGGGLIPVKAYPVPVKSSPASFNRRTNGSEMFKSRTFGNQTSPILNSRLN